MHNVARFFETMQNSRVAFIGTGVTNGDIIRLFRKRALMLLCWTARIRNSWEKSTQNLNLSESNSVWGTAIWIP